MKLEQHKILDVQRIGDTDDGIEARIDESSLPYVFDLVSKHLYSDPISSMIRELTSNCFDSHIEAGIDDPVVVSRGYDGENGWYIEFKDVGVGMSPDRVKEIYMSYFSSTKRETNDQIGAFGIGSKTPLAYTDMFYITTIYNGIIYEYLFHKGESKPTLELLSEEETTEHNGTTIRVYMKNDEYIFEDKIKYQLAYFDNVWFAGWSVSNDYDIYEGNYFKFRSDINQRSTDIHICIGKVRYPINFNRINILDVYRRMPIAVKFEIGELKVTPSREELRYDEGSIKLIQERVNEAGAEIVKIFSDQNPVIDSLEEYIDAINNETPRISFNYEKGHYLNLWAGSKIDKKFKFGPLENIPIKKIPKNNLFFQWKEIGEIHRSGYKLYDYSRAVYNEDVTTRAGKHIIFDRSKDRLSKYTMAYISEMFYHSEVILIERKPLDYKEAVEQLGLKNTHDLNKGRIVYNYAKVMDGIVKERIQKYSDFKPTEEWILNYKRSIIESTAAYQRKLNNKIFVRDILNGISSREIPELDFEDRTGIIVYGFKEDRGLLERIARTISTCSASIAKSRERRNMTYKDKSFMVIQIAKNVEKYILCSKKTIHCEKFLKTKFFRKLATLKYANTLFTNFINYSIKNKWFADNYIKDFSDDSHRMALLYNLPSGYSWIIHRDDIQYIEEMLEPLNRFIEKYSNMKVPALVDYISRNINSEEVDHPAHKIFIDYLKKERVSLKYKFYLKTKRDLAYEKGVRDILNFIKAPITSNLLTYTLNKTENGNIENSSEICEETSNQES